MAEARLAKARQGYEGYVYQPAVTKTMAEVIEKLRVWLNEPAMPDAIPITGGAARIEQLKAGVSAMRQAVGHPSRPWWEDPTARMDYVFSRWSALLSRLKD